MDSGTIHPVCFRLRIRWFHQSQDNMDGLSQVFNVVNVRAVACASMCMFMKEERANCFMNQPDNTWLLYSRRTRQSGIKYGTVIKVGVLLHYCLLLDMGVLSLLGSRASLNILQDSSWNIALRKYDAEHQKYKIIILYL